MVGTNLSMAHAANIETLEFFEEFLPIYHIKNPSTFTRYYSGLFALLRIQHNITAHICISTITTSNFCYFRIWQVFHIFLETKCHFCTPIARQLLTRSWLSNCHNAKVCPSQQTTGPPGVVTLTWGWLFTSSLQSLRWRKWWWLARVLKAGILAKILPITLTRYKFPRFTY